MAVRDAAPEPVQPEAVRRADHVAPQERTGGPTADGTWDRTADGAGDPTANRTGDGDADRDAGRAVGEAAPGTRGTALLPLRRPTAPTALPVPLRSGLSRATRWRRPAHLEPLGSTLRRVARHPAVVGSASAATLLVARAGVEVLREAMLNNRRANIRRARAARAERGERGVLVGRRVVVEYVELWSRPR
jgi:hypothetical protein